MDSKGKVKIVCAVITLAGSCISFFAGNKSGINSQNKYIKSQVANVYGDDNTVTINSVNDLIKEYVALTKRNYTLEKQNQQYFDENTDLKATKKDLEDKTAGQPEYSFVSAGLMIDGDSVPVDTVNSVILFNGKEYWSKELASKLVSNDKQIRRLDDSIIVGNIVADPTNLFSLHINDSSGAVLSDMGNDSYGNAHSNVLSSYDSMSGHAVFVLNRKYKYLRMSIAASDSCRDNATMQYTIKSDGNVVYTSKTFNKQTQPFSEAAIDIGNCNLLTIEFSTDNFGESFIYDAVVFNVDN